jgi:archaellum component FlaC
MAEKIKLDDFLKELVGALNKKLEVFENDINLIRSELERIKTNQRRESLDELKNRIRSIESTLSTAKDLNLVDKSILKMLESEESARRA